MPTYQHDCDACKSLGEIKIRERGTNTTYDLYVCPNQWGINIIARYGNNGPEYISVTHKQGAQEWGAEHDALRAGYRRAMAATREGVNPETRPA